MFLLTVSIRRTLAITSGQGKLAFVNGKKT
jgi:hypothetical protein